MTPETLALITKISLIVFFALIIVGILITGFIGWKKGIWRSTYKMLFMLTLVILAAVLLTPISQAMKEMPLSFLPFKSIKLINQTTGEYYYVAITTFEQTIQEVAKGYYLVNHLPYTSKEIAALSVAISETTVKLAYVLISMLLVLIFGNLLQLILWHLAFKRIVPKACERLVKIKWLAMIEGAVSFALLTVLFISPLTSFANIASYNYKRQQLVSDNQTIKYIDAVLTEYDNSIIGKLYGLTMDEDGLTLDAKMLDWITSTTVDDYKFSLFEELDTITNIGIIFASGLAGNGFNISFKEVLSDENIDLLFDTIANSELMTTILPIAIQIVFNLDAVKENVDYSMVTLTKEEFKNDLNNMKRFVNAVIDSGVIDNFLNEDGTIKTNIDLNAVSLIKDLVSDDDKMNTFINIFYESGASSLIDKLMPSTMMMLANMSEDVGEFLPDTWDEMNNINWGDELGLLLKSFQKLYNIEPKLLDSILGSSSSGTVAKQYAAGSDDSSSDREILKIILDNVEEIGDVIFGETDIKGNPLDVDKFGITKADGDINKYNLFDGKLAKWFGEPLFRLLGDAFASSLTEEDQEENAVKLNNVINELGDPNKWRVNYKQELSNMFDVIGELSSYDDIMDVLESPNDVFSDISNLDDDLVEAMTGAFEEIDDSKVLYATFVPVMKNILTSGDLDTLGEFYINTDIVEEGFDECVENKIVGKELALFFSNIKDLNVLDDFSSSEDPISLLDDEDVYTAVANVLDVLYLSKIFNSKDCDNENYFNAIERLFDFADQDGFEFKTYLRNEDIQWANARDGYYLANNVFTSGYDAIDASTGMKYRGENGNLALALASIGETNLLDVFSQTGMSVSDLTTTENRNKIHTVLVSASYSEVISATLGAFMDIKLDGQGLIDEDSNFGNVVDWREEADKLDAVLRSINQLDIDLSNFDLTSVTDVVGLNDMLHNLADSTIFIKHNEDNTTTYTFNGWLLNKLKDAFSEEGSPDLLKDPEVWLNSLWGEKEDSSNIYSIVERDFDALNSKEDWICENYTRDYDYSEFGDVDHYFDDPDFYNDYFVNHNYAGQDELGRIVEIVYWMSCKGFDQNDVTSASPEVLSGALTAVNNTKTLRMIIYNAYTTIRDSVNDGANSLFSLEQGRLEYLINCSVDTIGEVLPISDALIDARQEEIDDVVELFKVYKNVGSLSNINSLNGDSNIDDPDHPGEKLSKLEVVANGLKAMMDSNVYHALGPKDEGELTPLQHSLKIIYENDVFSGGLLFNPGNSPKDDNAITANKYTAFKSSEGVTGKGEYVIKSFYKYGSEATGEFSTAKQCQEIDLLFSAIDDVIALTTEDGEFDFTNFALTQDNVEALRSLFKKFDQSMTLFDVVPNTFYSFFNDHSFTNLGVDMTKANPYFVYDGGYDSYSTASFENRMGENEIDRIMDIMLCYDELEGKDLTNLVGSEAGEVINTIEYISKNIHDSYMLHKYSDYNDLSADETIFEELMHKIIRESQLQDTAGELISNIDDVVTQRIKNISALENGVSVVTDGYSTDWFNTNNGEATFVFNFVKYLNVKGFTNADALNLDQLDPTTMNEIMTKLNSIYLSHGALSSTLKNGFDSIGLSGMSSHNGVDYASYLISQKEFGGDNPNIASSDSEISLINIILDATYEGTGYLDLSSGIAAAIKDPTKASLLETILTFVDRSHFYNVYSSFDMGSYTNLVAKDIFLYNTILKSSLQQYVTGYDSSDSELSAINGYATMDKIFNFTDGVNRLFDVSKEASSLTEIIKLNEDIDNIDKSNISLYKDLIVSVMANTYSGHVDASTMDGFVIDERYYIVSEIVGGIVEDVLSQEYDLIRDLTDTTASYHDVNYAINYHFKATSVANLTPNSYDNLNEVEKNGLDGGLSLYDKIQAMNFNVSGELAKMGATGHTQSHIAVTYYITKCAKPIKSATDAMIFVKGSAWSDYTDNPNGVPGFSFEQYGVSLENYMTI